MRLLLQLVIFVTLVLLRPVLDPPRPEARPALAIEAGKVEAFTARWEEKSSRYRRHGDTFRLDEPESAPAPLPDAVPDPGAPTFDGLSSTVPAAERRRMRMDRMAQNLLGSLLQARLVALEPGADRAATGLEKPVAAVALEPGPLGLEIGGETPSGSGRYARSLPDGRLFILPQTTVSTLRQLADGQFPVPQF